MARPVCTQDSVHNSITDPIMDRLPIGTADEELVLRAEKKQMVARYEGSAETGRYLAGKGLMKPYE